MRFRRFITIVFTTSFLGTPLVGQKQTAGSAQRDPQALSILESSIKAAGGTDSLANVQDYVASGKIVYYWAGKEVEGHVTLEGRGASQFRLEASLPDGVRTWAVNNGTGSLKEIDGRKNEIPPHNTVNLGSLTLPSMSLLNVLRDSSISIAYQGLENKEGSSVHHIRSWKTFSFDPNGLRSKLTTKDFYIDATTFNVTATLDMVHPKNNSIEERPHELRFSDYRPVSQMLVPFSIVELFSGQPASAIDLTEITFNHSLQDSDFDLN